MTSGALPAGDAASDTAVQPSISLLMSTGGDETAAGLEKSLDSLRAQTLPPDQIVLVVDGPVDSAREALIERFGLLYESGPTTFTLLRLPRSQGFVSAMNAGLELCRGAYTMRMDGGDVNLPDRIAVKASYLRDHPDTDFVSSWTEESFDDGRPSSLRTSPVTHEAILQALRWRNVIVHPTICVRTELLRAVGGYRNRFGLPDYDLFVRLAQAGARFHVIPKALLKIRSETERNGEAGRLRYALRELDFRRELYRTGFVNLREFVLGAGIGVISRLVAGGGGGKKHAAA